MQCNEFLSNNKKLTENDLLFSNDVYKVYGFDTIDSNIDTDNFIVGKLSGGEIFVDGEYENDMFCNLLSAIAYITGKRLCTFSGTQFFVDSNSNLFLLISTRKVSVQ